jgi:hypothetical protein
MKMDKHNEHVVSQNRKPLAGKRDRVALAASMKGSLCRLFFLAVNQVIRPHGRYYLPANVGIAQEAEQNRNNY